MNIKATLYRSNEVVRIIGFVPISNGIKAVYVDSEGKLYSRYIEGFTITDPEYELEQPNPSLPREW